MRRIAHISDLHFGRVDPEVADAIVRDIFDLAPVLVIISGDITQRARARQFAAARRFLDRIPFPKLIVPGNHDIPLYNLGRRFLSPLGRYKRYISQELNPCFVDDEVAVFGINTARPFTWINGRISDGQLEQVCERAEKLPPALFKIAVTHHPFTPPPRGAPLSVVGRARKALRALESCGIELVLSGHFHMAYTGDVTVEELDAAARRILVVHASTLSTRRRGEPNAYNAIDINHPRLSISSRVWDGSRFYTSVESDFVMKGRIWEKR
jgi:3',5'-cyclic AMP phosphodiesterase CpdA